MSQEKVQYVTSPKQSQNWNQVCENFKNLNEIIDELDVKVDMVIEKHEGQFLFAYRNHIKKIKFQLREIKERTDEQEKKLTDNDRMYYLEKQIIIFREEALKLYDKLQQKSQEAEIYRSRVKDLEKALIVQQVEAKELMKHTKMTEAKLHLCQTKLAQVQEELKKKNSVITDFNSKASYLNTRSNTKPIYSNIVKQSPLKTVSHSKGIDFKINKKRSGKIQDTQLKEWFIQCVKSIKKDVAYRKNSGYQLDFSQISNIQEFKMVDKLRLLQKFMENQKLLTFMYEKIFPTRMNEIRDYLSQKTLVNAENSEENYQPQIELREGFYEQVFEKDASKSKVEIILPKMTEIKAKNSHVRNKVGLKQGKLNLSMV